MANPVRILFLQDTVLKQSTEQASQLPSNMRQNIPAGTCLVLQSYGGPDNTKHYKIGLKSLQLKGFTTWYIFSEHVEIADQPLVPVQSVASVVSKQTEKSVVKIIVDKQTIPAQGAFLKMVFNVDTIIKRTPVDGKLLNDNAKQSIPAGTELPLATNRPDANNTVKLIVDRSHVKFNLKDIEIKGFNQNWFAFFEHAGIQRIG
ncbi:MAG: hypothetical protein U7123_23420 [Potamolinea sp.]